MVPNTHTTTTTEAAPPARVDLPTADELDTAAKRPDFVLRLYLVPTAERTDEGTKPKVELFTGIGGGAGTPAMAYHRRWLCLTNYGAEIVGQSVLDFLRKSEDMLVALASCYEGNGWDGNNLVGHWSEDYGDLSDEFAWAWHNAQDSNAIQAYWSADDWYGASGMTWAKLCHENELDPNRVLEDDWEEVVAQVIACERESADQIVSGVEEYVRQVALEYRREQTEDEQ